MRRYARTLKASKHQTGRSIKPIDRKKRALRPGKRKSRARRIYYEYRRNRSDVHPALRL
jgi:hypothetical protein